MPPQQDSTYARQRYALTSHVCTPLLGVSTGLRSFTALAVTAWFARTGTLPVAETWASWVAHPAAVGTLTAAAAGEWIGDKLPMAPSRVAPVPLVGRLVVGGLVGAIVATALRRPVTGGVAMGAVGAALGAFGGFSARRRLTKDAGLPDLPIAIAEDALAIALAVVSLRRVTA